MAIDWEGLFGKESVLYQLLLWNVIGELLSSALGPVTAEIANSVNALSQQVPLTPPDLADLVVRGYLTEGQGAETAKKSGVSPDDFHHMVQATGQALDTTSLMEAFRRQYIPWDAGSPDGAGALQGIREGHLADKWADVVRKLAEVPIGIADAVDAVVESQITRAEGEAIAYQNGISAASFDILYNTRGNPPSPGELMELVRRGLIPVGGTGADVLSFDQGISEGATKNKWTNKLAALIEVIPPARTVGAMQRDGSLTSAQAAAIYRQLGYSPTIAEAFVKEASRGKTQAARHLAKADVLALYADGVIDAPTATGYLALDGYEPHEAAQELQIADLRAEIAAQKSAVAHVRSLYLARKLSAHDAARTLDQLAVAPAARDKMIELWQVERGTATRILTPAEITDAFAYQVMTQDEASAELVAEGYTEFDAWALLSIKNKAALPGRPAGTPSPEDRIP